MKHILVAYFSCSGVTRKTAELIADATGGVLYEIKPEIPYTVADLDWTNSVSRSSKESKDASSRPAIAGKPVGLAAYDTVFLGFPIWWYTAPQIIRTFLESQDFSGKTVVVFATSGSSGIGNTVSDLRPSCGESTVWKPGKLLNHATKQMIAGWISELGL